jgi:hypothetical protein
MKHLISLYLYIWAVYSQLTLKSIPNTTHPTIYTEGSIPVVLCPNCAITYTSSSYNDKDERFLSTKLKLVIKNYIQGTDELSGSFGALTFLFHPGGGLGDDDWQPTHSFVSSLGDGVMVITWLDQVSDYGRMRSAKELTLALQSIRFQARGRNPTEKGRNMQRIISISIEDIDGYSTSADANIIINGRNDNPFFPSTEKQQHKPLQFTSKEAILNSGPSIPVHIFPLGSVSLEDLDDTNATRAELCFEHSTFFEIKTIILNTTPILNITNITNTSVPWFRLEKNYPGRIVEDVLTYSPIQSSQSSSIESAWDSFIRMSFVNRECIL